MVGGKPTGTFETEDERNPKDKFLDGAKYIGKNFWKVLPFGSGINYHNNLSNNHPEEVFGKKIDAIYEKIDENPGKVRKDEPERIGEEYRETMKRYNSFPSKLKRFGKKQLHGIYAVGVPTILALGFGLGVWPHEYVQGIKDFKKELVETGAKIKEIESNYDSLNLFENAENFQDSLEIYQKYGFPIKLENPSLNDKKKAINQKSLEGKVE